MQKLNDVAVPHVAPFGTSKVSLMLQALRFHLEVQGTRLRIARPVKLVEAQPIEKRLVRLQPRPGAMPLNNEHRMGRKVSRRRPDLATFEPCRTGTVSTHEPLLRGFCNIALESLDVQHVADLDELGSVTELDIVRPGLLTPRRIHHTSWVFSSTRRGVLVSALLVVGLFSRRATTRGHPTRQSKNGAALGKCCN